MSIRSSVETHSRVLEPLLVMSLPNSLWWWDDEAAGGTHHEHQELCCGTRSRVLGPLLGNVFANFRLVLAS